MSRRSGEWSLLGQSGDPVPADGQDVRDVAGRFAARAAVLDRAHGALERLSRLDGWTGEAAEKFASSASEAVGDMDKARRKYADVATALNDFANHVDTARTRTHAALVRATDGDAQRAANATDPNAGVSNPSQDQQDASAKVARAHQHGLDEVSAAQQDLANAMSDLQDAVNRAKGAIDTASDHFSDGFWDDVKGFIRSIADQIEIVIKVLEWAAIVIAAVALVAAIVLTGGAAAAVLAAAFWLGAGVAAATLVLRTALVVSDSGKATWGDVAWDVAGLALCFVGGRAAISGAKAAEKTVEAVAARGTEHATASAAAGLKQTAKNALHIRDAANPLKKWATSELKTAAQPGIDAVEAAAKTKVATVQALRRLSLSDAQTVSRIRALQELGIPGAQTSLDEAARAMQKVYGITAANTAYAADALSGKVTGWAPSDYVKEGVNHLDEQGHVWAWRLELAGRTP